MRGFQIQIPMGKADSRSEQSSPRMIQLGTVGPGGNWKASQLVPCNNAYVGIEIASFFKQCQRSGFFVGNLLTSVQFSSVTQLCPALCDPMNCSMPGLPVHYQLPESTQTHVH